MKHGPDARNIFSYCSDLFDILRFFRAGASALVAAAKVDLLIYHAVRWHAWQLGAYDTRFNREFRRSAAERL